MLSYCRLNDDITLAYAVQFILFLCCWLLRFRRRYIRSRLPHPSHQSFTAFFGDQDMRHLVQKTLLSIALIFGMTAASQAQTISTLPLWNALAIAGLIQIYRRRA